MTGAVIDLDAIPLDGNCSKSCGRYVSPRTLQGTHAFNCPNVAEAMREHEREQMLRTDPATCRNLEANPW